MVEQQMCQSDFGTYFCHKAAVAVTNCHSAPPISAAVTN